MTAVQMVRNIAPNSTIAMQMSAVQVICSPSRAYEATGMTMNWKLVSADSTAYKQHAPE
jgi:hypothetical protein